MWQIVFFALFYASRYLVHIADVGCERWVDRHNTLQFVYNLFILFNACNMSRFTCWLFHVLLFELATISVSSRSALTSICHCWGLPLVVCDTASPFERRRWGSFHYLGLLVCREPLQMDSGEHIVVLTLTRCRRATSSSILLYMYWGNNSW